MSKKSFYFSHDSNARNDEKILALRMRHRAEGYGVYFMILERLVESTDYTSVKDYNALAFDLRVSAEIIKSIIEEFGLFAFTDDGKRFYSESLLKRMQPLDNIREQRRQAGLKSAEKRAKYNTDNQGVVATVETKINDRYTEIQQSKVKENKVKESKETQTTRVCDETQHPVLKNQEIEKKEKSSAKKEKDNMDIKSSEFFRALCVFFSQTNEVLQMRTYGDLIRFSNTGELEEFRTQAQAYMQYKRMTGEKIHRWQNFIYEWKNDDWINKLKKERDESRKQPEAKLGRKHNFNR